MVKVVLSTAEEKAQVNVHRLPAHGLQPVSKDPGTRSALPHPKAFQFTPDLGTKPGQFRKSVLNVLLTAWTSLVPNDLRLVFGCPHASLKYRSSVYPRITCAGINEPILYLVLRAAECAALWTHFRSLPTHMTSFQDPSLLPFGESTLKQCCGLELESDRPKFYSQPPTLAHWLNHLKPFILPTLNWYSKARGLPLISLPLTFLCPPCSPSYPSQSPSLNWLLE